MSTTTAFVLVIKKNNIAFNENKIKLFASLFSNFTFLKALLNRKKKIIKFI